jgi:YesN/AraC family two-component response regulator
MIMPNMGGQELAQVLKEVRPAIRMLFVSGYSEEAFSALGVLPPEVLLLPKPFSSRALLTKMREVLD